AVTTHDGRLLTRSLDIAPGFPGADLNDAQHLARFDDCLAYAPHPVDAAKVDRYLSALQNLSAMADVRPLVSMLAA
ncbi:MAG: MmgE/PrpD family protein, partial [Variovorax sp.]|nr:MmgE/PrpD family protein [Variovorax sp.]